MAIDFSVVDTQYPQRLGAIFDPTERARRQAEAEAVKRQQQMQALQLQNAQQQAARAPILAQREEEQYMAQQQAALAQQEQERRKQEMFSQLPIDQQRALTLGAPAKDVLLPKQMEAPKTRTYKSGKNQITEEWNPAEGKWNRIGVSEASSKQAGPLSAQGQKELFEADETVQSSSNVISSLNEALRINKNAYSGVGAKERAFLRSQLPGEDEAANNTILLDNIVASQALDSLKAIFGGMPTEGERKILLDLQASVSKTPDQRKEIMNRAIKAAERRMKFNQEKAKLLRSGEYFEQAPEVVTNGTESGSNIDDLLLKYQ